MILLINADGSTYENPRCLKSHGLMQDGGCLPQPKNTGVQPQLNLGFASSVSQPRSQMQPVQFSSPPVLCCLHPMLKVTVQRFL